MRERESRHPELRTRWQRNGSRVSEDHSPRRIALILFTLALIFVPVLSIVPMTPHRASAQSVPSGAVIVVLTNDHPPSGTAEQIAKLPVRMAFKNIFTGYAMDLTPAQAQALSQSPAIAGIYADEPITAAETVSNGVKRIGAPSATQNPVQMVNTTVAVIDTGVQQHPNLNVVGGFDASAAYAANAGIQCGNLTPSQSAVYEGAGAWGGPDINDHGTHVAGIIGAEGHDGVVGVAPGAGILAVRVLDNDGDGTLSSISCGLDWMLSNQFRYNVGVANISIQGPGVAGGCNSDVIHIAVCAVYNAGIPIVVAGGNNGQAGTLGVYPEVLSVSAFNDFDGLPGGLGTKPSGCNPGETQDDQYATYNLSGNHAQIMAPGTCIWSTLTGGGYGFKSGTSMAAPHVTGAIALYKASNPGASLTAAVEWLNTVSVSQSDPAGLVAPGANNGEKVLKLGTIPTVASYAITNAGRTTGSASPSNAYDNDMSTAWVTTQAAVPTSAYVYFSLGSTKPIGTIRWVFGSAYGSYADSWEIQLSTNRVDWTTVATESNADPGVWQNLTVNRNATFVRFLFTNPNHDPKVGGIAEVKIFPADSPTTDLPTPTPTATPSPSPTATPVATPYKITVGNRSSNSSLPSLAYDNNMGTSWVSTSTTPSSAWVIFGLGAVKPIGTIRYVFGAGLGGFADSWKIQVSADKIVWTTIANRGNASPGTWKDQAVNRNARWVRFIFSNPNGDVKLGGIAEVQILPATGPTTDVPTATPTATATATATPTQNPTSPPATGNIPFTSGSSRSTGSSAPSLAFDGDLSTQWITTQSAVPSEAYLLLSLGGQKSVGDLWWVFATTGFAGSYVVQITNDKITYETIRGFSNAPVGQWQTVSINKSARYIRFLFSNNAGTPKLGGIGEVRAYPPASGASVASISTETPIATETPVTTETPVVVDASPVVTETPILAGIATSEATETAVAETPDTGTPAVEETASQENATETATEAVAATEAATEPPAETATEAVAATEAATETPVETAVPEQTVTEVATEPAQPTESVNPTPDPGVPIVSSARSEQSANATTAFDGRPETDWRTDPESYLDQGILQFDLGQPTYVSTAWWLVAVDAPGGRLVIDVSLDGETWSVVALPETFGEPGTWVSAPLNVEARYIRFRFINDDQRPALGGVSEVVFLP